MNLKELKAKGAFVPVHPIKKSVTWKNEDEEVSFDVFVRKMSFGDYERLFLAESDDRSRMARVLCESVKLGDEGKDSLSYEDAYQLNPSFARVLLDAVNEVNGVGAPKA